MAYQLTPGAAGCLGLVISGDIGHTTVYRDRRGRMVIFDKTFPQKSPSPDQQTQRQRLTDAAAAWRNLTQAKRTEWELASRRASLGMHGYALYVYWHMTERSDVIATIERQTRTNLLT